MGCLLRGNRFGWGLVRERARSGIGLDVGLYFYLGVRCNRRTGPVRTYLLSGMGRLNDWRTQ
jgi:hypothetical protein